MVVVALGLTSVVGCSGEPDPEDPEDAYDLFRHALFEGDGETMWERTDEETRDYFEARFQRLEEMDELIERYLPQTDHEIARSQSGAELLDDVDSGRQLFVELVEPDGLGDEEAVELGAQLSELQVAEEGDSAVAVTRGGQEFLLVRADDEWFVNLVDSGDVLERTFEWLRQNEDALEQTVENLIEEERQVREEIIADLMDVEEQ